MDNRRKSRSIVMASMFVVTFLAVTFLVEQDVVSRISWLSLLGSGLVIGLIVWMFSDLIGDLDEVHLGWRGAMGWVAAGILYALVLVANVRLVDDKFLNMALALISFYVIRGLVFKLLSLWSRN